jgi:hypothetical protein
MSIREANARKARRRCLKCGKVMFTDRCHRICTRCTHQNEKLTDNWVELPQDLCRDMRALCLAEAGWSERTVAERSAYAS